MAGEKVGDVRVETLEAGTRSAHPTARLGALAANRGRLAPLPIGLVRVSESLGVDEGLETMDTPVTLEAAHHVSELRVNEPVQRGHRCAVAQVGLIFYDHGLTVGSPNHHGTPSAEWPTQEPLNGREVVG
jgi:hypothetical protein